MLKIYMDEGDSENSNNGMNAPNDNKASHENLELLEQIKK